MKAFLIDPDRRSIEQVEYEDTLDGIKAHLGDMTITGVYPSDGTVIFADDEGLLKGPANFTRLDIYPEPLAGRLLWTGPTTRSGHGSACPHAIEYVQSVTHFMGVLELKGFIERSRGNVFRREAVVGRVDGEAE